MSELPHLSAAPGEVYWRETEPTAKGKKMLLLTIGGVAVIGCWTGKLGESFVGWSPLPKRHRPSREGTANLT